MSCNRFTIILRGCLIVKTSQYCPCVSGVSDESMPWNLPVIHSKAVTNSPKRIGYIFLGMLFVHYHLCFVLWCWISLTTCDRITIWNTIRWIIHINNPYWVVNGADTIYHDHYIIESMYLISYIFMRYNVSFVQCKKTSLSSICFWHNSLKNILNIASGLLS